MDKEKNTFEYTYYAPTEEEKKRIESIRRRYDESSDGGDAKFERLKSLDAKIKNVATCLSLTAGIAGCLIFGAGLSMILEFNIFVYGIIVMAIGTIAMAIAYPSYNFLINKGKKKYGKEIVKLADELLNRDK